MNALIQLTAFAVALALSSSSIVKSPGNNGENFELLILHNNDMHARFEQTSQLSGTCTAEDREAGKCYGGFPRVAYVVKEARRKAASGEGPPVLYLNAGDTYTGTAWFTIYKWKVAAEFINALQPDAVSLGNNDFESGSTKFSPFINSLNTQIVSSNVLFKNMEGKNLETSVVIDIDGRKVGVIGYLKPENKLLDSAGDVEYIEEVLALKEEVEKLQTLGIDIIIALGHSDFEKDLEIAREVDGVDIVIGGHKNMYYWNGTAAENQILEMTIIKQNSGKQVLVTQSYAYNKYLGRLSVIFDKNGDITKYSAEPVILDNTIPQDLESMSIHKINTKSLALTAQEVLGQTSVVLDGQSCRTNECNLGNLITDSMMYYYATRFEGDTWTDAPIAVIHGAAIAASISPDIRPASVTRGDLLSSLPVASNLVVLSMNGTILTEFLEHSVADYNPSNPSGQFLQFSGVRVIYDFDNEPGTRIVSVVVRCWSCLVPQFFAIDDWREYKIIMPLSLLDAQYGFTMLTNLPQEELAYDEVTCLAEYLNLRSPVYPEVAGRTILLNSLGNHELDNGVSGLTPFIENVTCPVLAANLNLTMEPTLESETNLMNSVVFNISNTKIGVIGYLTPETQVLAVRNDIIYEEEVSAIKKEVDRLKKEGVKIFIALGHSGFTKDLEIAKKVEDIDLVIGGHTNTFLWNGLTNETETPEGPYPTIVKQKSGKSVPAVQAYAYTKYLGKLHLVFNTNGDLISFDGNPILLDKSVPQDPDVLSIVNKYRGEVLKETEIIVGQTSVILDGHSCRVKECNMGNFIADAMVNKYASEYKGVGWTDAPIAIIQGGGIRSSIAKLSLPANVTKGDVLIVLPFGGNLAKVSVNGTNVLKMLEHAVAFYRPKRAPGQFLQVSGIQVQYDFKKKRGKRVTRVLLRCGTCDIPTYSALNVSQYYNILMPSFLSTGGDGFSSLGNHEFDNDVDGLTPFIENLNTPVLAANLILSKVPELAKETNLKKSVVINTSGHKVGIVGYLTPDTKILAKKNDVEYIDEIVALKEEVPKLKDQGCKIIIALGHSGFSKDLEIGKEVDGIDLVIGGHSNTFLWNGTSPDSEEIQGPYPTYVVQHSGKLVPVVQAYAYTKYLGKLHLIFDTNGNLVSADGYPILLNSSIPQDTETLKIVDKYRLQVSNTTQAVVGTSLVPLDGLNCQKIECNLGNLIADAMIYTYVKNYTGKHWTDAPIAIIQGGGIRASITHTRKPAVLTRGDLLTVLPFKGSISRVTMNGSVLLQVIEYSSLGNHEFDEEVEGVIPFIRNLTSPVLAANLILDNVPELQNEKNLHPSVVIPVNDIKIGIIGYLTPETKYLAPKNKIEYEDEVVAIRREVNKLKKDGVNILIALGHSGYIKDLEIAKEVDGIDLVIGGHSNTFLWNGNKTEEKPEIPQGPYPKTVKQSNGKTVLVVQAYAYTKYMGRLHLNFNKDGDIIDFNGAPVLLNQDIPKDPELQATINKYRKDIDKINGEVVGVSSVFLDGECRLKECNIGDLIVDAVVNYTRQKYAYSHHEDLSIAIVQGGRIRTSLDRFPKPFEMTRGDWITVLPFSDLLTIVTMNGKILKQALEHSVSTWREIDSTGQFLQISGIKVAYNLEKPPGSRIIDASAVCNGCGKPGLSYIKDSYEYKVAMPEFLAKGGDGFTMFETLDKETLPYNEVECVFNYLKQLGPVNIQTSNRIKIKNVELLKEFGDDTAPSRAFSLLHHNISSILSILIVLFSYVNVLST
ncbi:uncharacterized protein LOC106143339 [Amyelois transitella]|uniref:uncharacterized protein LOC106143339 n=1 Tax=Amyelois transitella TaxID=680683 RepID=UPI0029901DCE|nr:uncharacterized protein LOC106143339 [Amyelois transitella]